MRTVAAICRCEEHRRVYECTRQLSSVDAPRIVFGRGVRLLVTVVAVEIVERAATLLNDVDAERSIRFDVPAELVAVVDIERSTDTSGDVRLISRYLALGVNALAAHIRE